MVADNKLTQRMPSGTIACWASSSAFLSAAEIDFSLEITGFDMREIDFIIENLCSRHQERNRSARTRSPTLEPNLRSRNPVPAGC